MRRTDEPGGTLAARLRASGAAPVDLTSHRPQLFEADDPDDVRAMHEHVRQGEIAIVADTIEAQLQELVQTRSPGRTLGAHEARVAMQTELGGRTRDAYGTWVHYPWDRRLVHVLPEPAYRELRGDRNRNKITTAERMALGNLKIGVVGLSVGQAIALALAQEGVGQTFHLADFDRLSFSNLNRIRGSAHTVGCNKAVMTARAIAEIDPYARVTVFEGGVTAENLEAFLCHGGTPLDVVVEECDSIETKIAVRLAARQRRIPVVMVNSEGGVLDIERFDLEPERPIFHGLVGEIDARMRFEDHDAKVAFLLPIVGAENLSDAMVASLVEIDETVSTWPQLASGVALGSALATDAVRRMALGRLRSSGRFVVDVEQAVRDGAACALPTGPERPPAPWQPGLMQPPRAGSVDRLGPKEAAVLVQHAVLAPSGGNAQPWAFRFADGEIACGRDPSVELPAFDPEGRSIDLALGAAVENIDLAARAMGLSTTVRWRTDDEPGDVRCRLSFAPGDAVIDPLLEQVARRCTNRTLGDARLVAADALTRLSRCVEATGARLLFVQAQHEREALAEIVGEADRLRVLSQRMLADLESELRWSAEEVERGDGIDVRTLALRPGELATLRLLTRKRAMQLLADQGGGRKIADASRRRVRAASAVGLVVRPGGGGARGFFAGGRALQRMWLQATALRLAVAPTTTLLFLLRLSADRAHELLPRGGPEILDDLRRRFADLFPTAVGSDHAFMFMLGHAPPPEVRSRRRVAFPGTL